MTDEPKSPEEALAAGGAVIEAVVTDPDGEQQHVTLAFTPEARRDLQECLATIRRYLHERN